jgi:uncharacterized protein YjbI with pentapeptide repeats
VVTESEFRGHAFAEPADFRGARFPSRAYFEGVDFRAGANFQGAVFEQGATFFDCRFAQANFSWCRFNYQAYFWRSHFEGEADFSQALILKGPNAPAGFLNNGEANFSWAWFGGEAKFARVRIEGPAYFWATRFRSLADLSDIRFESDARFEGAPWRVCVSRLELGSLYDELVRRGVLHPDPETSDGRFANFLGVESEEQLVRRMGGALPADAVEAVRRLWTERAQPMFSDRGAWLTGVTAANPSQVLFTGVNLGRVRIAGSGLAGARFEDVEWDHRRVFGALRRRSAAYDERECRERRDYETVCGFYHDLRVSYEQKNRLETAGDFYYGEMEMRRMRQPRLWRAVSLTAWFKYLSGYGENYALALAWLAAVVLVLCPALYIAAGFGQRNPVQAVLHSLEVVTFLKESGPAAAIIPVRFVEGVERVLAAALLGLFLPAIQRKFSRR